MSPPAQKTPKPSGIKCLESIFNLHERHKRTSPTSAEKSAKFSADVGQLLTSSFVARRMADFYACSPPGKTDEWCLESALVGFPDSKKIMDKHLSKQVLIHN